jgi:hypothetical protein
MLPGLFVFLSILAVVAWLRRGHTDASVEPFDEGQIREAEDRFWEEAEWDDPEEVSPGE